MYASKRFKAFIYHFLFSILIGVAANGLVFLVWYPNVLASISGVTDIFILLLVVDVILGPLITLIIFNVQKKELKRDMAIVVFIQLVALSYGVQAVFSARPVYIAFTVDRFDVVYANNVSRESLAKVSDGSFKSLPLWGPKLVSAQLPEDEMLREAIVMNAIQGDGSDVQEMPEFYRSYELDLSLVVAAAIHINKLSVHYPNQAKAIDYLVRVYAINDIDSGYLPLQGKSGVASVIVNRATGEILDIVNFD